MQLGTVAATLNQGAESQWTQEEWEQWAETDYVNAIGKGHPFFGEADAFEGKAFKRPWDVHARTPCNLLVINMRHFRAFMRAERLTEFAVKLDDYSDTRRRGWELSNGVKLGPYVEPPSPEPAPSPVGGRRKSQSMSNVRAQAGAPSVAAVTRGVTMAHMHGKRTSAKRAGAPGA